MDRKILDILQRDATVSVADVGRTVGLSATPCWKRIQKLEADGVIRKRVALLAPEKLGLSVAVRVFIQTGDHATDSVAAFVDGVRKIPEVVELHRVSGDFDFALRVLAADVQHYDRVYRRLSDLLALRRVTSYFELAQLKCETAVPLDVAPPARTRTRVKKGGPPASAARSAEA